MRIKATAAIEEDVRVGKTYAPAALSPKVRKEEVHTRIKGGREGCNPESSARSADKDAQTIPIV